MLRVGTILHDTYRIDSYLASGGFGNTYVATNVHFHDKVAVKEFFMKGVSLRDNNNTTVNVASPDNEDLFEAQRSKFKKEAQRLHELHSEHIVGVTDFFDENGTSYYVMDYIDGESLENRLKRTGRPIPEQEALSILRQVLDALLVAHGNNPMILHMDIKPGNIMVDKSGNVKLIDFGASKQLDTGGSSTSSAMPYTNGYAPLEQIAQDITLCGPWTDFYALGATLYAVLTNSKPPMPSSVMSDATVLKQQSLPLPDYISDRTKKLIVWMMQVNSNSRPRNVQQIIDFLDENDDISITQLDPPPPPDVTGPTPPPVPHNHEQETPPPPPPTGYGSTNTGSMPPPVLGQGGAVYNGAFPDRIEFTASFNKGLFAQTGKIFITPTQFIFHPFSFNIGDTSDKVFNIADLTNYVREAIPTWLDLFFNNKCYLFIVFSRERIIGELEKRRMALQNQ